MILNKRGENDPYAKIIAATYYCDIYTKRAKEIYKRPFVMVHGYMFYRCEDCGFGIKMYLEKGLEDHVEYEKTGKHKPVPFTIGCPNCGGLMEHILWGVGSSDEYTFFGSADGGLFAEFGEECGLPVIFGLPEVEKEKEIFTGNMNRAERRRIAHGKKDNWEDTRWHRMKGEKS